MLYCLFRHAASQVLRDVAVRAGQRIVVEQLSAGALRTALVGKVGVASASASRAAPRAAGSRSRAPRPSARYAYWDTLQVASTARRLLGRPSLATSPRRARRRPADDVRPLRAAHASRGDRARLRAAAPARRSRRATTSRPRRTCPSSARQRDGERELAQVRWGLVPRWAKDPSIGARMINARAETLADKPAFRNALQRHRCLLPADGFYEWSAVPGRQAADAHRHEGRRAVRAGRALPSAGCSPDGEVLDTCTIVTTQANALLRAAARPHAAHRRARATTRAGSTPRTTTSRTCCAPCADEAMRSSIRCRRASTPCATTTRRSSRRSEPCRSHAR